MPPPEDVSEEQVARIEEILEQIRGWLVFHILAQGLESNYANCDHIRSRFIYLGIDGLMNCFSFRNSKFIDSTSSHCMVYLIPEMLIHGSQMAQFWNMAREGSRYSGATEIGHGVGGDL